MDSLRKKLLIALGLLCAGLGVLGALLPLMPSTVFWLLAAWCFARSSPAFRRRLLAHPWVGPSVRSISEERALTARAKRRALIGLWGSLAFSALVVSWTTTPERAVWVWGILGMVGVGVTCLILLGLRTLPAPAGADDSPVQSESLPALPGVRPEGTSATGVAPGLSVGRAA